MKAKVLALICALMLPGAAIAAPVQVPAVLGTDGKPIPSQAVICVDQTGAYVACGGPAPNSSTSAAATQVISSSAEDSHVLCAAACNLYSAYVTTGSTPGYFFIFNTPSKPANGSYTGGFTTGHWQECVVAPANASTSIPFAGLPPESYSVGAVGVFSTTGCGTLTASATAIFHAQVK